MAAGATRWPDFDGNGYGDVAVYRAGKWEIHYLGPDAPADIFFRLEAPLRDRHLPQHHPGGRDWDGDGIDDIGTYDCATGTWVLKNTVGHGGPHIGPFVFWGGPGSYPSWATSGASASTPRATAWAGTPGWHAPKRSPAERPSRSTGQLGPLRLVAAH